MAKKNREVATPAAPGKGAAPAPEMPQMGQFVKQLAILPVMWGAGTVDFTKPDNLLLLRTGFCLAMGIAYLMVTFAIFRCKKLNDGTRVQNPGTNMYIKDEDKAADGSVSVRVYDTSKLQETKMRLVFSLAIAMFLHLQWEYTQPLLVMGIMTPMQMLDDKAVAVHVRGKSGPGYERPWASAAAGNPLGAWAERMQEQQQQPQPAAAKKKN